MAARCGGGHEKYASGQDTEADVGRHLHGVHHYPEHGETKPRPPAPREQRADWLGKIKSLKDPILPGLLIGTVLSFIVLGIATTSEAAAVGAAGSVLCVLTYHTLILAVLKHVLFEKTICHPTRSSSRCW